jgi:hypothetical protein
LSIDLSFLYPLYSLDPRAVWKGQLALLLSVGTAAAVMVIPLNPESRGLRWLKHCGAAGIMLVGALQFALLIRYLFYPSYLNHGEANNVAVSWLGWEGYPLYPRLDTGDVYGVQYGPAFYQAIGFFLWLFEPSIAASKILGLTAFALSQVLSFLTVRRTGSGVAAALTMTAVQCVVLAGFTDQGIAWGVRSDALLFFGAQTAVLVATFAPTMLTAGALGLLGGLCVNLKIHAALYILPAFVYHLCRSSSTAMGLRLTCAAGLAGAVALAVPFSPNNVSLFEYYHYFQVLKHTSWDRWLFQENIVFAAMCLAPIVFMYALFTPKLPRALEWFIGALALCMTIVEFPAAERGAGPHHLLPFLPSIVWGFAVMRREVSASLRDLRAKGRYEGLSVGLIAALLFGFGPIVIGSWGTALYTFAEAPLMSEGIAEIERVLHDNQDLKVAVGPGAASTDVESLRVIPVFRGNPLPIDSTAWMAFEADGVSDEVIKRAITECRVNLWLLPSGKPFVMMSHFNGENIFSPEAREDFDTTYTKEVAGPIFDQWRCKRKDADPGKRG